MRECLIKDEVEDREQAAADSILLPWTGKMDDFHRSPQQLLQSPVPPLAGSSLPAHGIIDSDFALHKDGRKKENGEKNRRKEKRKFLEMVWPSREERKQKKKRAKEQKQVSREERRESGLTELVFTVALTQWFPLMKMGKWKSGASLAFRGRIAHPDKLMSVPRMIRPGLSLWTIFIMASMTVSLKYLQEKA